VFAYNFSLLLLAGCVESLSSLSADYSCKLQTR